MGGSRSIFLTLLAVYMLLYAAFGALSPFLPALLREQGLQAEAIGIVLAASTAIRVVAGPVIGHAADRFQNHTATLCMCALAATLASIGYVTIRGFGGLLMVAISHAAMLAPLVPISDALATTAARRSETEGQRFGYGWLRASGSAAFVAGTVLSGWSAHQNGLAGVVWISGLSLLAGGIMALLIPHLSIVNAQPSHMRTTVLRDWVLLLKLAVYRRMLVIAALVEGSHALNDTFAVIHWRTSGVNLLIISLLWSESVLSEVVVFLLIGPKLIRRIAPSGACALAAVAGVVRWSVLACTTSPFLLGLAQPLHGFTFALLHLACMRIIVMVVPMRLAATAQSIYNTLCIGLVTAVLTLVSGVLYDQLGALAFLAMAALCLLALPMCRALPSERKLA
jgi:PPP family 3-phenylpropionic acid transporter